MKRIFLILCCFTFIFCRAEMSADTLNAEIILPKKPALALAFSAVIPGGGQYYNGKWFKGLIFSAAELGLVYGAVINYSSYSQDALTNANDLEYAKYFTWFGAAVYVYSLMDAFVDAHLSFFPDKNLRVEPEINYPGLSLSYHF